jgi:hypothetical protein
MLDFIVGLVFICIGTFFVVFCQQIAVKEIWFQKITGSIWTGPRSLTFATTVNVIGGISGIIMGLLIIGHRIPLSYN